MTLTLRTPVTVLKGCGPKKNAALLRLGIKTVEDLLRHYPSGYTFAPEPLNTSLWGFPKDGEIITYVGHVIYINQHHPGSHNFSVVLDGGVDAAWFGGHYLRDQIFKGSRLIVSGEFKCGDFINPAFKVLRPGETPNPADLNTVTYPVTAGITSKDIGRLVRQVLDTLYAEGTAAYDSSVWYIHRPVNQEQADKSRTLLKYDELFYMQLGLAVRRAQQAAVKPNVRCDACAMANIAWYFPFKFTEDQWNATVDILWDMAGSKAMNRLLQGDVGCGKTAVAAYAAIVATFNSAQTAILCPTEILARQHYETVRGYFEKAGVKCALLLGGASETKARSLAANTSPLDIVIGTTALLSGGVTFRNLGLVIIDEQHKFGVEQRAALTRHGNPHVLVMTATPIPRTLAMTVFGDLDISVIKSMPPGRMPIETRWIPFRSLDAEDTDFTVELIAEELSAGHQVYVVCPRIEALDDEMRAVEEVAEEYTRLFPDATVGVLHGQMKPIDKQLVVGSFADGDVQILVSTTVIEVGVDNPNATVMVVEGAERFGLAQLHQLRGRVGRGKDQSYCFLLSDTDSAEARARLQAMERTNDGFEIAEQDLKLRGPGDLLSTRQHGLPDLKLADLVDDFDLMLEARKEAFAVIEGDPALSEPGHRGVRAELIKRFGDKLTLGGVG